MSRCTGHCCRSFTIDLDALTDPEVNVHDGDYIREMVILKEQISPIEWLCTCIHFDGQDCAAYADRPSMCSLYPYGRGCRQEGCTLTLAPDEQDPPE